jgi:hypothetical protein
LQKINEDIEYEKNLLRELKYKITELESSISFVKTINDQMTQSKQSNNKINNFSIISTSLSRHSPYIGTKVLRVAVCDKYVSWHVMLIDYEPLTYSKSNNEFPIDIQQWVDDDIYLIKQMQIRSSNTKIKLPTYHWNSSAINSDGIAINRMSWHITEDGSSLIYKLEDNVIPINPFGRTGLKGRGALPRWGPNHYVIFVITALVNINTNLETILIVFYSLLD